MTIAISTPSCLSWDTVTSVDTTPVISVITGKNCRFLLPHCIPKATKSDSEIQKQLFTAHSQKGSILQLQFKINKLFPFVKKHCLCLSYLIDQFDWVWVMFFLQTKERLLQNYRGVVCHSNHRPLPTCLDRTQKVKTAPDEISSRSAWFNCTIFKIHQITTAPPSELSELA